MRYPNLRYGNPNEMAYYAQGVPAKDLAKRLRRSERSVNDWLAGKKKVPWWIPELLRLQRMEAVERHRQMGFGKLQPKLGIVTGDVIQLHQVKPETEENPIEFTALALVASN
jgi:hypothetical protein